MLEKIVIADLLVGMYVVDTGLPWLEHPYLYSQEGVVASEEALRAIREAGYEEAFVDTDKGSVVPLSAKPGPEGAADVGGPGARGPKTPLDRELVVAKAVYRDCLSIAHDILRAVQGGGEIDVRACSDMVDSVIDSAVRNPDALLALCKLRRHDAYTFSHGVNVSVVASAFGVYLGLPGADLKELGLAGLYHDLGKTGVPDAILNKPGRLTELEFHRIMEHPALSGRLLAGLGLPEGVVRGVTEHHERFDGTGYPTGLAGAAIHKWARVLALADVYDALTSQRSYKGPMLPTRALAVIHGMRDRNFPANLAERFIKFLGPYPVGACVRLASGEYGLVRASNPARPLAPEILVVCDAAGNRLEHPRVLDLAREDAGSVAEAVDPAAHGLDPAAYLLGPA